MPSNSVPYCIRLSKTEHVQLKKLAVKNNMSASAYARQLIEKGMSVEAYQNDEAKILSNTKAALKEVLDPQIERIVKISVKNSVAASTDLLYTAFLMQRMAKGESKQKLEPVMDEARRLAIAFVSQAKGSVDDFIRDAVYKINAMWEDG